MKRIGLIALGLFALSCKSGDADDSDTAVATCDTAAQTLNEVCLPLIGEEFRSICELEEFPLLSPANVRCAAEIDECTEEALEACNVRSVVITCSAEDDECPAPFKCDTENLECARCLADDDCAPGRACLEGDCYDEDSEYYRRLNGVLEQDGGAP